MEELAARRTGRERLRRSSGPASVSGVRKRTRRHPPVPAIFVTWLDELPGARIRGPFSIPNS